MREGGDDGHCMAEMVRWIAYRRDHLLEIRKGEYLNSWVSGPGGFPLPGLFCGITQGMSDVFR